MMGPQLLRKLTLLMDEEPLARMEAEARRRGISPNQVAEELFRHLPEAPAGFVPTRPDPGRSEIDAGEQGRILGELALKYLPPAGPWGNEGIAAQPAEEAQLMPIHVTDLQPGDRVMLNCPKSRVMAKREAQFEGCYKSIADAMEGQNNLFLVVGTGTAAFLEESGHWAGFLFGVAGAIDLRAAFAIDPDGSMRDEEGRKIYVERRLGRVNRG